jgi:serine phosphatase RsbU (regulator of sigma subunit)
LGRTSEALEIYRKTLALSEKLGNAKFIAHSLSGIAVCLAESGEVEESHKYMTRAIAIVDTLQDPYELAKIYANTASIYMIEKDYTSAESYYRKALGIFREIGVREELVNFYNEMALLFNETKRYDSALVYWKQYMVLKDSLVNEDVLNHQRNLEALYESEKGKQEIELLTRKGNVRQWFLLAIIASFVVLVFLVIMLYKRNQFRKITNRETERQNAEIEEKNRNITDSISYASRIQEAVIPSVSQLKSNFTDAFVLSKPKDIVSGDFWWCTKKQGVFYLAGADSTGHGVPGGFMSMLGSVFLFDIITEKGVRSPAAILNHLREKVISTLNRSGMGLGVKDGMDMVMCTFSENNRKVQFSCAMNPLWVIRKNAVIEYRADKFPVGEYHGDVKDFSLLTHDAEPGDMIYIFSDGYADQFGGPDGKKLKYKQLRDILCSVAEMNCDEQRKVLDQKFQAWKNHHEQVDDVLVIGIRI